MATTGDEHTTLKLGKLINPVAVGVLVYVLMHYPTLSKAFDKLCQYQDIICDAIQGSARR